MLHKTHGIMLYQEDVTRVAMALAGFSMEQADQLRKALNKKRKAKELKEYQQDFYRGAIQSGVSPATIEAVWTMILSFAGYSFCKPHSASYAQVSFKCAYLKAHYPAEFMAAVLSNEGGYYPTLAYISEARRMGLEIKPPDINNSAWRYEGRGGTIQVGFMQIRGIKKSFVHQLIAERNVQGPFRCFREFCLRTNPELAQARLLIKAGCFDSVADGLSRPGILWQAYAHEKRKDPGELPNPEEYTEYEKLEHEIESFGFPLSCHPLDLYRANLAGINFIKAIDLKTHVGKPVRILGWLIMEKLTQTKKGDPMEFVTFEDRSGIYEATFFPDTYMRLWHRLMPNRPFVIEGVVEEDFGALTLNVKNLEHLDVVRNSCYGKSSGTEVRKREKVSQRLSSGRAEPSEFARGFGFMQRL
jgi:error-prone DNA polymerase